MLPGRWWLRLMEVPVVTTLIYLMAMGLKVCFTESLILSLFKVPPLTLTYTQTIQSFQLQMLGSLCMRAQPQVRREIQPGWRQKGWLPPAGVRSSVSSSTFATWETRQTNWISGSENSKMNGTKQGLSTLSTRSQVIQDVCVAHGSTACFKNVFNSLFR